MTKYVQLLQMLSELNERQIDILIKLVDELKNATKEKTPR